LKAWKAKKAEVDAEEANRPKPHQQEYERAIEEWSLVLQWSLDHNDEPNVCIARDKLKELRARLARKEPPPVTDDDRLWSRFRWPDERLQGITASLALPPTTDLDSPATVVPGPKATTWLDGTPGRIKEEVWRDRIESQCSQASEPEQSIAANVKAFLAVKEGQVRAGELTAGRYTPIKLHLHDFQDWLGPTSDVSVISGKVLSAYHADLVQKIVHDETPGETAFQGKRRKLSADYARDRISAVKTFVRWLYETDVIQDLPKILTNKRALTISKRVSTPETFTIDEVKTLLADATPRTKLYLLLMLNCGMYQGDISDLTQQQVDWTAGRISRKRSKTRKHRGAPTVNYLLWKETFQLLCQERSTDGDRVLLNDNGGPLKIDKLCEGDDSQKKIDNVASAYQGIRIRFTTSSLAIGPPYRQQGRVWSEQAANARIGLDEFLNRARQLSRCPHVAQPSPQPKSGNL
jgi:integrase